MQEKSHYRQLNAACCKFEKSQKIILVAKEIKPKEMLWELKTINNRMFVGVENNEPKNMFTGTLTSMVIQPEQYQSTLIYNQLNHSRFSQ